MSGQAVEYEKLSDLDTSPVPESDVRHKTLGVDLATGIKVIDAERGIVECIVSVTGNTDSDGERFRPGAWKKWLKRRRPKGVHAHNWSQPTAKTLSAEELMPGDDRLPAPFLKAGWGALLVVGQYNLATQRGREAFSDVVFFGKEAEWSVGFRSHRMIDATEQEQEADPEFRAWIEEAELYEWSDVLFGANPETQVLALKGARSTVVDWMVDIAKGTGMKEAQIDRQVLEARTDDLIAKLAKSVTDEPAPAEEPPVGDEPPAGDEPSDAPDEGNSIAITINLSDEAFDPEVLAESIAEQVAQAKAARGWEVDKVSIVTTSDGECASCSASGFELVVLDGAGYCGGCTKAMHDAADAEVGLKARVPFPIDALAELSA